MKKQDCLTSSKKDRSHGKRSAAARIDHRVSPRAAYELPGGALRVEAILAWRFGHGEIGSPFRVWGDSIRAVMIR